MTPRLLDLRSQQTPSGPPGAGPLVNGRLMMRRPARVDSLLLHQTAVRFGVAPYQIKAAGGDPLLAQFLRAKNIHAHVTAFDEGTFCPSYPLLAYVWHANGGSPRSIGLECEGLFHGRKGDTGRSEPSDLLIETSRAACTWIVEEAAREGATLKYYLAHRQFSGDRRSDPGWRLWQAVGIDHCEKVLGLAPLPTLTNRKGTPIPEAWDPRQKGVPY